MKHLAVLIAGELYSGYAGVVYWRLRGHMAAEITETRSWLRYTPPWHLLAPVLLPALPALAEVTCLLNGLLWPAELVTRPCRTRP